MYVCCIGSGKSTILRILLGLEPIRAMGPSSAPSSSSSSSKHAAPISVTSSTSISGHGAVDQSLPNAAGSLSIDGMDVSGSNRVPCFAMAGQDSDLFRGMMGAYYQVQIIKMLFCDSLNISLAISRISLLSICSILLKMLSSVSTWLKNK